MSKYFNIFYTLVSLVTAIESFSILHTLYTTVWHLDSILILLLIAYSIIGVVASLMIKR